ncbi:MAG TPA: hypothetical protein VHB21_27295, partial [Minicystis sp.]|nr:hypothetical protein [Minicystis sp.]
IIETAFPGAAYDDAGEASLGSGFPEAAMAYAAHLGETSVLLADFGINSAGELASPMIAGAPYAFFHGSYTAVDWFCYGIWAEGELVRGLSLSPDDGIIEDVGDRLAFEGPFWAGARAADLDEGESYPLPFHPLDLANEALATLFGFRLEGERTEIDPLGIRLAVFRRRASPLDAKLARLGVR